MTNWDCAVVCCRCPVLPQFPQDRCVLVQDPQEPCCMIPYCDFVNPTPFPNGTPTPFPALVPTGRTTLVPGTGPAFTPTATPTPGPDGVPTGELLWRSQHFAGRARISQKSSGPWLLKLPADRWNSPFQWSAGPVTYTSNIKRFFSPYCGNEDVFICVAHTLDYLGYYMEQGQWLSKMMKLNTPHKPR